MPTKREISAVMKIMGAKGGAAGRGTAKARSTDQARAAAMARWAKAKKKKRGSSKS
jgi:hypothetical protein